MFGVLFDGFAYGMLLFLLSVGLSVTLGMMNFVNLAHCAFAMLGGYVTVTLMNSLGWPFLATLPVAFLAAARGQRRVRAHAVSPALPRQRSRPVLLTIGLVFMSVAVAAYIFGTIQQPVHDAALPARLVHGRGRDARRLPAVPDRLRARRHAASLVLALEYTRFGAQVRAAVDNQRMARGLGINVDGAFAVTFALGSGLAGLGGALAIEIVGLDPAFAFTYLVYVLIVVVGRRARLDRRLVRGRRRCSASATWPASITFPSIGAFLIYLVMVGLLMWRPAGLFGRR